MPCATTTERVRAWRAANPDRARAQTREATARYRQSGIARKKRDALPFIAIDGEGAGTDDQQRQNYLLIHAAGGRIDHALFKENRRLQTAEILDFVLTLPRDAILVGYFFGYDATQILRDLPETRLRRMFGERDNVSGSRYTFWGRYAIEYVPRQYFRVALVKDNGHGRGTIPGSARTINEVGGFFQKSFVEALKSWGVGTPDQLDYIGANKERRSEFTEITQTERDYCRLECKLLVQLMNKLRDACRAGDMIPRDWRGAGALAAELYRKHKAPKTADLPPRPSILNLMAGHAYYGGRFEVAKLGRINAEVWEHDINSAYPDAMRHLPCPVHTTWTRLNKTMPSGGVGGDMAGIWIADITFDHPPGLPLCGFPCRSKGRLFWPRRGRGSYWSCEILGAVANGATIVKFHGGYQAVKQCECRPYDWIAGLYDFRKSLGKSERGFPIKLGINALYGKKAQRQGGAPYRDMVAAGLITALTRAKLLEAYHEQPDKIIMLATDGVFATVPLNLEIGDELGLWERKHRDGLFVVQPGIYWSREADSLPKTRGVPRSRIIDQRSRFESVFDQWSRGDGEDDAPGIAVALTTFIGHRLALARNKPGLAGQWMQIEKRISFDWGNKRERVGIVAHGGMVETTPYTGSFGLRSEPYDPHILTDLADQLLLEEAMPDWEPWGNSGE